MATLTIYKIFQNVKFYQEHPLRTSVADRSTEAGLGAVLTFELLLLEDQDMVWQLHKATHKGCCLLNIG